jgi:hypothetical protein
MQEDGEIKAGTINEGRETVILGSYGRILRLSRQAIVNDDLGAFDQVFGSIGLVVARFENATFFAMKALNSGNGPKLADNVNFFNAAHGNLAGSGTRSTSPRSALAVRRCASRRTWTATRSTSRPSIILTGPDIETTAEQFLAPIAGRAGEQRQPVRGKLQQEVEAVDHRQRVGTVCRPVAAAAFNLWLSGRLAGAAGDDRGAVQRRRHRVPRHARLLLRRDRLPRRLPQPRRLTA